MSLKLIDDEGLVSVYISEDVPEGTCGFTSIYKQEMAFPQEWCCERECWEDTGLCIWHADIAEKPIDELQDARSANPERLDGARLGGHELEDKISWSGCILIGADFSDAILTGADFSGANLSDANLAGADLRGSNLKRSDLRRVELSDADIRGANMADSAMNLNETDWDSISYSGGTQFGKCVAEAPLIEDYDKAIREYRTFQQTLREQALPHKVRKYRVYENRARRRQAWAFGNIFPLIKLTLAEITTLYGESPWRVGYTSLAVILVSALLYPFVGGIRVPPAPEGSQTIAFDVLPTVTISMPSVLADLLTSFYFSVVTFTTLGYGDLQPASGAAQALATVESFLGALLMALLVFVLGRRTTW